MDQIKIPARLVSSGVLGIFLSTLIGCGAGAPPPVDPAASDKQKQARYEAYGKAGIPTGKGTMNSQAAARRRNH